MNPLLMPVVVAQGAWTRFTIKMAAEATGPVSGTFGDAAGQPLRLAVLGESTAAGCGVETHGEGFTGSLARELAARTNRPVAWEVAGQFGATGRRIRYRLVPKVGTDLDFAVVLAGANDVLTRCSPQEWRETLGAILDDLTERAGHVVLCGVPPFALFPSLPSPLRRYLGERGATLDEVSQQVCAERPRTSWMSTTDVPPPEFFSHDRFHPSAAGYRQWAARVADHLALGRLDAHRSAPTE